MASDYRIISYNKEYVHSDSLKFGVGNRAFKYGDGFFETMHANGLEVQFLKDHYQRIQSASNILSIELPDYFSLGFLAKQISGLLSRCKLFQAAKVKLTVLRSGEGLYFPETNKATFIIEANYLGKGPYELNTKGIVLGLYQEISKPAVPYLQIKSLNAQIYIMAALYAKKSGFNDVLLVNEVGGIVEATSSNLFIVKEQNISTPSLNTGCVSGIMRKQVIGICNSLGYNVEQSDLVKEEDLLCADEIFLTNAVVGLKYISAYQKRRYYNRNSKKIMAKLNELAF